jgi:hypothetical protein
LKKTKKIIQMVRLHKYVRVPQNNKLENVRAALSAWHIDSGTVSRFFYDISGLPAVTRNIAVFWYMTPYSPIDVYRHGGRR